VSGDQHRDADRFGAGTATVTTLGGPAAAVRAYTGVWAFLVQWFRVPEHPPTLPTATGEEALSFRPSSAYLRYLKLQFWIGLIIIDVLLTALWIAATVALIATGLWFLAIPLAPIAIVLIVVPDIIVYVGIHLRFDTTWYVLSKRSLRVRHGIWIIRELTLTFENVQNVRLLQGPLQRHFGIASVLVETAGGGGMGGKGQTHAVGHNASIDGITNAEEIRDLILARVRASRMAGLGDEHAHEVEQHARVGAGRQTAGSAVHPTHSTHPRHPGLSVRQLTLLGAIRDELRAARAPSSH